MLNTMDLPYPRLQKKINPLKKLLWWALLSLNLLQTWSQIPKEVRGPDEHCSFKRYSSRLTQLKRSLNGQPKISVVLLSPHFTTRVKHVLCRISPVFPRKLNPPCYKNCNIKWIMLKFVMGFLITNLWNILTTLVTFIIAGLEWKRGNPQSYFLTQWTWMLKEPPLKSSCKK